MKARIIYFCMIWIFLLSFGQRTNCQWLTDRYGIQLGSYRSANSVSLLLIIDVKTLPKQQSRVMGR